MNATGHQELAVKFSKVICFLAKNPEAASNLRNKNLVIGSADYIALAANIFSQSRTPRSPEPPTTVPDEMVSLILNQYFGKHEGDLKRIKGEHLLSMAAENMVGDLLERYLADRLEPKGWIWISGSLVKGADFLKPPMGTEIKWQVLQVKNRDNSENSSSSAIREGTEIQKWFRTFSKKEGSNWAKFPDSIANDGFSVSEEGFKKFVKNYLLALKQKGGFRSHYGC